MPTVTLSCGDLDYIDSGGDGPVLVFTHGVLMNGDVWEEVIASLTPDYRCLAPTLPLGAHLHPMRPGTDLSISGLAAIVAEFLDRLEVQNATLVVNAVGAPLVVAADQHPRLSGLVLATCEAFTEHAPGARGRNLKRFATIPDGIRAAIAVLRAPGAARVSAIFGSVTKRGVPGRLIREWSAPGLATEGVRDDLRRYLMASNASDLDAGTRRLPAFAGRTLLAWAADEQLLSAQLPHRLHALIPGSHLVLIEDSYTLVPLDQPQQLAEELRAFLGSGSAG